MDVGDFWTYVDRLVAESAVVMEHRRGTADPDWPGQIYPLDYGYLAGTRSMDGAGIDVWLGSGGNIHVAGVLCTVDLLKRDSEIKLLLGCSEAEMKQVATFMNVGEMRCILLRRPGIEPREGCNPQDGNAPGPPAGQHPSEKVY